MARKKKAAETGSVEDVQVYLGVISAVLFARVAPRLLTAENRQNYHRWSLAYPDVWEQAERVEKASQAMADKNKNRDLIVFLSAQKLRSFSQRPEAWPAPLRKKHAGAVEAGDYPLRHVLTPIVDAVVQEIGQISAPELTAQLTIIEKNYFRSAKTAAEVVNKIDAQGVVTPLVREEPVVELDMPDRSDRATAVEEKYPLLRNYHAYRANFNSAMRNICDWKATIKADLYAQERESVRSCLTAILCGLVEDTKMPGYFVRNVRPSMSEMYPGIDHAMDRIESAIEAQAKAALEQPGARGLGLASDEDTILRLRRNYTWRAWEAAWDKKLYPETLMQSVTDVKSIVHAVDTVGQHIIQITKDDPTLLASLFPRRTRRLLSLDIA